MGFVHSLNYKYDVYSERDACYYKQIKECNNNLKMNNQGSDLQCHV